ncbi:MAG: hypothetical protein CL946_03725 [Ectothiorhodospiraceae bacterium]|nr:hypothetical protein [Ectothiorhodospiraceae bacterium]
MLSIKKQLGPSNGWRVGIGIDGESSTFESIRRNTSTDTTTSSFNQENDDLQLQVIVEYISYIDTESDIKPYFAVGPRFALESVDNFAPEGYFPTTTEGYEDDSYSIGLSAEFGVEWFFAESMSLMAEYGLVVGYYKFSRTETATFSDPSQNWTETREAESFDIEDTGGRLGISVYF